VHADDRVGTGVAVVVIVAVTITMVTVAVAPVSRRARRHVRRVGARDHDLLVGRDGGG